MLKHPKHTWPEPTQRVYALRAIVSGFPVPTKPAETADAAPVVLPFDEWPEADRHRKQQFDRVYEVLKAFDVAYETWSSDRLLGDRTNAVIMIQRMLGLILPALLKVIDVEWDVAEYYEYEPGGREDDGPSVYVKADNRVILLLHARAIPVYS